MCADYNHLSLVVQNILEEKGEGGILRKMNSKYVNGRSNDLIKLKVCNIQGGEVVNGWAKVKGS